jgi:hypothetical protein
MREARAGTMTIPWKNVLLTLPFPYSIAVELVILEPFYLGHIATGNKKFSNVAPCLYESNFEMYFSVGPTIQISLKPCLLAEMLCLLLKVSMTAFSE